MSKDYLSQPIKIGPLTAKNRFVINAMECCDSDEKGNAGPDTYERYTNLFEGGAGIVVLEIGQVIWFRSQAIDKAGKAATFFQSQYIAELTLRSCRCHRASPATRPAI